MQDDTRNPWAFQRWAYEQTTGSPARKAVLMCLAITADMHTGRCEALRATLAEWAEVTPDTVSGHLRELAKSHDDARPLIARREQKRYDGGRRGDEFLLLAPWVTAWPDGEPAPPLPDSGGEGQNGEGPSLLSGEARTTAEEKTTSPTVEGRASASEPVSYTAAVSRHNVEALAAGSPDHPLIADPPKWSHGRTKEVPIEVRRRALACLGVYNLAAGQMLAPFRHDGGAAEHLKRITGAVLDHPDVDLDAWSKTIRRVLSTPAGPNRYWGDSPSVGVVFGPNVVDRNLQDRDRPHAAPSGPAAAKDAKNARAQARLAAMGQGG